MSAETKLSAAAIERKAAYAAHTAERLADKIRALREELEGYEKYGKDDRAALVREQLEELEAEAAELDEVEVPDGDHAGDDDQGDETGGDPDGDDAGDQGDGDPEPETPAEPKSARATQPRGRRTRKQQDA